MARKTKKQSEPREGLRFSEDVIYSQRQRVLTSDDVARVYASPATLGAPEEHRLAMDSHLHACGVHSLLSHAIGLGMGYAEIAPQFLGYAYLAGLSQNALIRAGVTTVAEEMTKKWIEIYREEEDGGARTDVTPGDEAEDDILKQIKTCINDFGLQAIFNEAAQKCDFEGGCLVYIDTGDSDEELEEELVLTKEQWGDRRVRRFVLVEAINLYPGNYNASDPLSPDYFTPTQWLVLGKRIHASRFLYFAPNKVHLLLRPAYNFFGIPAAQQVLDYVAHFTKTREAAQRLLTKFSLTVFKSDMGAILSGQGSGHMDLRLEYLAQKRDNDSILLIDKEREDVIKLETPIAGVTDVVRQSLEFIATIFRLPLVKFLGISPGGLNATGDADMRNFYDHIESKQRKIFGTPLDTLLDVIQLHLFGRIDPQIKYKFVPLTEEDEMLKAQTFAAFMGAASMAVGAEPILSVEEVRHKVANMGDAGMPGIDPADVPMQHGDAEFEDEVEEETGFGGAEESSVDEEAPRSMVGRIRDYFRRRSEA